MQAMVFVVSCYNGCKRLRLSIEKNKGMDFSSWCQDAKLNKPVATLPWNFLLG